MCGCYEIGGCYEMDYPTVYDAFDIVVTHRLLRRLNMERYKPIIIRIIENIHSNHNTLGSWKGFYRITLQCIIEKTLEIATKNAYRTLTNSSIIKLWVNHVLYRMPSVEEKEDIGTRVKHHRESFEKIKIKLEKLN
tara:strand:+ start:351 stop:758 length:408 start_codon:yes stop_codon:yes gene_type:complete